MQRFLHEGVRDVELSAGSINMNTDLGGRRFSDVPISDVHQYPAPRIEPLCYPGVRPEHSFTISEGRVWPVAVTETDQGVQFGVATDEGVFDLNDALEHYGVARMEDRYPIVGFGSNACPGQLAEKFSAAQNKWGDITTEGDHHIVPTLRGTLRDVAAAYSSKLGIHGYMFAELIEAPGAETEVSVNFLSGGQLARMVRSENAYELCDIGNVAIDGISGQITAFGFVGKNPVLLDEAGKPILIDSVHTKGTDMQSKTEVEVLDEMAATFGAELDAVYPHSPVYANSASNLMATMSYRAEFLRRPNTASVTYKHHPEEGEQPDELVGTVFRAILENAGRTSSDKLLDHVPIEKRNVEPHTFKELYIRAGREQ